MLPIQKSYYVQYFVLENLNTTYSFKDKAVEKEFYKYVTNKDCIFKGLNMSIKYALLKGIEDKTAHNLQSSEAYDHTIEKSELYKGKVVTYYAPFDKCDRVEDYKVAWGYFEEIFKEK